MRICDRIIFCQLVQFFFLFFSSFSIKKKHTIAGLRVGGGSNFKTNARTSSTTTTTHNDFTWRALWMENVMMYNSIFPSCTVYFVFSTSASYSETATNNGSRCKEITYVYFRRLRTCIPIKILKDQWPNMEIQTFILMSKTIHLI